MLEFCNACATRQQDCSLFVAGFRNSDLGLSILQNHFVCSICGHTHEGLPADWAYTLPDVVWTIPAEARAEAAHFTDDLCDYGGRFFIRGLLLVPFLEAQGSFGWGVWAEVDLSVFMRYLDFYDADGTNEPPLDGTLANELPAYASSAGSPLKIQFQTQTQRPAFILRQEDFGRLASEQRGGMDSARYHKVLEAIEAGRNKGRS